MSRIVSIGESLRAHIGSERQKWLNEEAEAFVQPIESILEEVVANLGKLEIYSNDLVGYKTSFDQYVAKIESAMSTIGTLNIKSILKVLLWIGIQTELLRITCIHILLPSCDLDLAEIANLADENGPQCDLSSLEQLADVYVTVQEKAVALLESAVKHSLAKSIRAKVMRQ
ncbi:hypothetical protein AAF712_010893 [Marasmius tenuissimus]|uniref:Uncharacterized protein n=1 Tax=Marasmius tenuissimus TaxID=585030 RepID=A0ABR2ZKJ6_9AGAR